MKKEHISEKSYLERLRFDPQLLRGVVSNYITNIRLVALFAITIIFIGILGYIRLPKRLNPEIKIPIVTVVTVLPGASPEDSESLITIPLENAIRGIKGIDKLASVSRENVSVISIQFLSTILADDAKDEVQSKVDGVTGLPNDSKTPVVKALDFEDQPIWTFAISSTKDTASLMNFSENLKRKIEDISVVDRVITTGFENQEVSVVLKPESISQYAINPFSISNLIQKGTLSYPAGNMETINNAFSLTIDPEITTIDDIRNIRVTVQNEILKLGDIAVVSKRSKKDQKTTFIATQKNIAKRAVVFYVYKTTGTNIDTAGVKVKDVVNVELANQKNNFSLSTITNTSELIDEQFTELLVEFRSTIILIVGCLLLFLGLRQALISSLTVPLTFLSAFFIMTQFGQSINFLTLFAFLIALGLLIDDTVVVVSAMTTYFKTKKFTPQQTGLLVWRDTIIPIWSTTITTIQAFIPLLITSGIIGEFIKPIPIVVSSVMISSTAIAVLITLPLMIILLKPMIAQRVITCVKIIAFLLGLIGIVIITIGNSLFFIILLFYIATVIVFIKVRKILIQKISIFIHTFEYFKIVSQFISKIIDKGLVSIEPLAQAYYRLIIRILRSPSAQRKVVFAIVIYSIFSFLLIPLGLVQNEFFPKSDSDVIYANLQLPAGTNVETTELEAKLLLEKIRKTKEINFVTVEIGQQYSSDFNRSENSYSALFTVHLPKETLRVQKSYTIAQNIRNLFKSYSRGSISVVEESSGPPAGADLQLQISGDSLINLDRYANSVMNYLKKTSGVTNIDKSLIPGTSRMVFNPDKNKLALHNISIDTVGFWLRSFLSGFPMNSINFDKRFSEKTDVVFRLQQEEVNPSEISRLSIPTISGSVPISELGTFIPKSSPSLITRENGKRTIIISASVLPGFNTSKLNTSLERFADSLKIEQGYSWKTGGVNEENAKSVQSIFQAMIIAFILILVTMVLQFQSYRQAIIVLMVIPLAVSSVFIVFALTGTPLSFPALIGVLSLFGIVVTNSMFIVDKININRKQGMPFQEAIADAGASRLEPIILTKLNTILGLIPITLSNPLWRGLGGAIIAGILFSSLIMLFFIPTVYYWWFKETDRTSR